MNSVSISTSPRGARSRRSRSGSCRWRRTAPTTSPSSRATTWCTCPCRSCCRASRRGRTRRTAWSTRLAPPRAPTTPPPRRVDIDPNPGEMVVFPTAAAPFVSHFSDLIRAQANPNDRAAQRPKPSSSSTPAHDGARVHRAPLRRGPRHGCRARRSHRLRRLLRRGIASAVVSPPARAPRSRSSPSATSSRPTPPRPPTAPYAVTAARRRVCHRESAVRRLRQPRALSSPSTPPPAASTRPRHHLAPGHAHVRRVRRRRRQPGGLAPGLRRGRLGSPPPAPLRIT